MKPSELQGGPDLTKLIHKRNSQFETLNRLSALISQSESLEKALSEVLDQLLGLTGADIGSIHVLENKGYLKLIASRGVSQGFIYAEERIPIGDCLCGEAARTGELVFSPDLSAEPRLSRAACRDEQFGSLLSIPLKSRDQVQGILTIYAKRPHHFSRMDQDFLVLVGHQIGVAIENARLYARTRELAILEERGLIAQEIHDGIAQSLAYLNLEIKRLEGFLKTQNKRQALSELDHIREVIKHTYEDVRELLGDFRTKFKEGEGLSEGLRRYIKDFSQRTGIQTELMGLDAPVPLSPEAQVQVFRIIQEALSNIRKHACAKKVTVALSATPTVFKVEVHDDGRGFDPRALSGQGRLHLGMEIMKERAAHLEGNLQVESHSGRGTSIRLSIPVKPGKE